MADQDRVEEPVVGSAIFTHGTLAANELSRSQRFYREFLGIKSVRHVPPAQVITSGDCEFGIACVGLNGNAPEQASCNRWVVSAPSKEMVHNLYQRASDDAVDLGIAGVEPLQEGADEVSFRVQDCDKNWWEVTSRTTAYYDRFFEQASAS